MVQWSFLVVSPRNDFLKGLFIKEWTGLSEPGKEQPSSSGKHSSLGPGAEGEGK